MSIMEWFVLFSRNCGRLHHPAKLSQTSSKLILREGQGRGPGRDLGDRCLENILVINWISSLRLVALTLTTTKSKLLHNFRNFSDYCARAVLANNHTYRRWVGIGTITNDIHTYVVSRPWPPCKCRQNVTHCEWMESRCPRAFLWAGRATKKRTMVAIDLLSNQSSGIRNAASFDQPSIHRFRRVERPIQRKTLCNKCQSVDMFIQEQTKRGS